MNSEKLDNLFNLALDATEEEREKSEELRVGYDAAEKTWQLIVKSSGSLADAPSVRNGIRIHPLLNGYAVLTVPEDRVGEVSGWPVIEYIEKPKRLFFAVSEGRRVSCVNVLQAAGSPASLYGAGILVAVIDSGIDYAHPDFRNEDGTTRIVNLWDQTLDRVFDSGEINEALSQPTQQERYAVVPSRDLSGHGTHVAGICAGNGRASEGLYRGMAPRAALLVVKLGTADPDGFPRTSELMLAVDYVLRRAGELQMPVAVNLSFGNNYGSHRGTSLAETYLTEAASYWKSVIVAGTGNEGTSRTHAAGRLSGADTAVIDFSVGDYETTLNIQLWKSYEDQIEISLRRPDGGLIGPLSADRQTQRFSVEEMELLVYYGEPRPYSTDQEIYFDFIPKGSRLPSGVWEILLRPVKIDTGQYDLWLPGSSVLSAGTGFLYPAPYNTITIPATAQKVISVGAYDAAFDSYASFSGRGGAERIYPEKPDLAAPGVDIVSCAPGGGYTAKTGTSMAAPFVTGAAALLMEWGIRLGNDPYLYGEKIKAYLRRGARAMPGFTSYPNELVGYGALCVRDSYDS
ncbi:MAG: S8 family serine peptidase [Clostridiales bacterium]|nr:S8 family serine peptidase [Clostridiales bacterium]